MYPLLCVCVVFLSSHYISQISALHTKTENTVTAKICLLSSLKSRVSLQPGSCVMSCSIPHSCFSPLSTLFWTDWNREAPKIESSSVDGQNRRVVVSDGVGLPNALTFDSSSGQVCWADAGKHHSHCDCCSTASTITGSKLQVYLLSTILKYCWTDQRFPQGPDEKGGFLRSR